MSYDDRAALVSVVDETYALIGLLLAARVPLAAGAVRPEVVDRVRDAHVEPVFDAPTVVDLQDDYEGVFESVLELQEALLNDDADTYDEVLVGAGFRDGGQPTIDAFRRELDRFLSDVSVDPRGQALELLAHATTMLQPLTRAGGLSVISKPLQELTLTVTDRLMRAA
jgi:hypothetical protein